MTEAPQPIKRSKQLAILSREHHDGLLFVFKIKEGVKFEIDAKRITNYWFWENDLKNHFEKEEAALTKILPVDHPMMIRMLDDHEAIKAKLKELVLYPSHHELSRLAQIVSYHIRFEERELFTQVESLATGQQLEQLATDLLESKTECLAWDDEFWVKIPKAVDA